MKELGGRSFSGHEGRRNWAINEDERKGRKRGRKGGNKNIKNYGNKSRINRGRNVHGKQSS
jgi:hypothetical protein